MTAVAPPISFQPGSRLGWSSANGNTFGVGTMDNDEVSKMFASGPRKTVQRQNSSSSIASTASSASTISASSAQTNNTSVSSNGDSNSWATRKKPTRGLWPPGKAEPATGITTARPQAVNSATSGASASSAISALHAPMLPSSQQVTNGVSQANGAMRSQAQNEPPAILHLLPINGTFERKTITVPYYPEVLRIGRQTNQKTIPTSLNGYFDSKVLSRQHAEVWADRQGRIFIRDVKSSNGTFVNGMRLSQENKESEPRELREQDVLELGIDIVSEDQKTVVHHKVAAKVEHAGIYGQGNDGLNFGELDPSAGGGLMAASHQLKRNGSQNSVNGRAPTALPGQNGFNAGLVGQPNLVRNWLNPITTEQIVKKLNAEMKLAMRQSQDLARARQCIDAMLGGTSKTSEKEPRSADRTRPSPIKTKGDLKAQFSEPPAPPPQAPLPEKPDVARALADPVIQPLLRRHETAKPLSANNSPTRTDHSGDILRLCEELKLAKGEISSQTERMRRLETQLAQEKTARESAEERAQRLETGQPMSSSGPSYIAHSDLTSGPPDVQSQLGRLQASMDEMKQQMEAYRRRAESAETERDEARQTLAELIEAKRAEHATSGAASSSSSSSSRAASKSRRSANKRKDLVHSKSSESNGHALAPHSSPLASPTAVTLLERAGLEEGQPITPEQAKLLTQLLSQEVLGNGSREKGGGESPLLYHGRPLSAAAIVVIFGVALMGWMNSWPKLER